MAVCCALVAALILSAVPKEAEVEAAEKALADFRPEEAVRILDAVEGPLAYETHIRVHEQLGIAHAYLEQPEEAVASFRRMLALDPARALPYTLSPKVTFLFERARREAARLPTPTLDLGWPRGLRTAESVPIELEVVHDPVGFLSSAVVRYRRRGEASWRERALQLPSEGGFATASLPPVAAEATEAQTLELYVVARDGRGNEVMRLGHPDRPREIELRYERPRAWFERWWLWAAVGGVVAAGATAAAVAASSGPGPNVDGSVRLGR